MRFRTLVALAFLTGCQATLTSPPRQCPVAAPSPELTPAPAPNPVIPHGRKLGLTPVRFSYLAGTTGTVTIAAGFAVTGIAATANSSGSTMTIACQGPNTVAGTTGPSITIPASQSLSLPTYMFPAPNSGQCQDGSVIVFSANTAAYFIALQQVNP